MIHLGLVLCFPSRHCHVWLKCISNWFQAFIAKTAQTLLPQGFKYSVIIMKLWKIPYRFESKLEINKVLLELNSRDLRFILRTLLVLFIHICLWKYTHWHICEFRLCICSLLVNHWHLNDSQAHICVYKRSSYLLKIIIGYFLVHSSAYVHLSEINLDHEYST